MASDMNLKFYLPKHKSGNIKTLADPGEAIQIVFFSEPKL